MTNGDQPAFPFTYTPMYGENAGIQETYSGMTVREYFAAKAMQGLLASCTDPSYPLIVASTAAEESCKYADALIAELNKKEVAP